MLIVGVQVAADDDGTVLGDFVIGRMLNNWKAVSP